MSRPKFAPTKEQRLTVKTLSAFGIKQEAIARMVGLRSEKTLRKHFAEEITLGAIEAVAQVSQTLYQMAKSGKHPASTIHFLNSRRRWLDANGEAETPKPTRLAWIKDPRKDWKPKPAAPAPQEKPVEEAPKPDAPTEPAAPAEPTKRA